VASDHPDSALGFSIGFPLTPVGPTGCACDVAVQAQPRGALRLMAPLIRLRMPKTRRRLTQQMVRVIENATVVPAN
jgi:hypothetical protein